MSLTLSILCLSARLPLDSLSFIPCFNRIGFVPYSLGLGCMTFFERYDTPVYRRICTALYIDDDMTYMIP